jgi:hypothetical protein
MMFPMPKDDLFAGRLPRLTLPMIRRQRECIVADDELLIHTDERA